MERRREVYWRWSWDLRNSGGRWDGGWDGGKRVNGGIEVGICSIEYAGAMAATAVAYLHLCKGASREWGRRWRCGVNRGGILICVLK